jgi:transposase
VIALLNKLSALHPGRVIKIVLDNAAYQRCHLVREHAIALGIDLIFLPSYSPNLNLIERFWKFLKKKCLYNCYYDDFESFYSAIDGCIAIQNEKFSEELKTLMTLKFQSFENVQFLAV